MVKLRLAQNRWLLALVIANACGDVTTGWGARPTVSAVAQQATKTGITFDTTTPLGEFVETVRLRLAEDYPITGAAPPVSRKTPEEVYCCIGREQRDTAPVAPVGCILRRMVAYWRRCGAIL